MNNIPGTKRNILACAAGVFFLSLAASFFSARTGFLGGMSHEFCNYAEIARNIKSGRGFSTGMIYPGSLAIYDSLKTAPDKNGLYPVMDRFPLHAYFVAAAFRISGETDFSVLAVSAMWLALLSGLTVLTGGLFLGPGAASAAGLLIALNPSFQRGFILWGLPDFGFAVLLLSSVLVLLHRDELASRRTFLSGVLGGLAWLYRSNFLIWLPLFILLPWAYALDNRKRVKFAGLWLAGWLLAAFPGLIYNLRNFGNLNPPTFAWNLAHGVVSDAPTWLQYRVYSPWAALGSPAKLAAKWADLFLKNLKALPVLWQFQLVWPAAAAGCLALFRDRGAAAAPFRKAVLLLGSMLVLQVFIFCFLRFETLGPKVGGRYYIWFAPAAALLAVNWAAGLKPGLRYAYIAAVSVFFAWQLFSGPPPRGLSAGEWPELKEAAAAAEGGLLATNLPGQAAWYAGAKTLQLPVSPEELMKIMKVHQVEVLLLSRRSAGEPWNLPAWRPLAENREAFNKFCNDAGFRFEKDFGTSLLLSSINKKNPSR